jgi:hypothetical protein
MGTSLESLTVDSFSPAVGDAFTVASGDPGELEIELTEAKAYEAAADAPSENRAPFGLRFRGPTDPVMPQGTYALEHSSLGTLEIFLVPIGQDASGTTYEAIFA